MDQDPVDNLRRTDHTNAVIGHQYPILYKLPVAPAGMVSRFSWPAKSGMPDAIKNTLSRPNGQSSTGAALPPADDEIGETGHTTTHLLKLLRLSLERTRHTGTELRDFRLNAHANGAEHRRLAQPLQFSSPTGFGLLSQWTVTIKKAARQCYSPATACERLDAGAR